MSLILNTIEVKLNMTSTISINFRFDTLTWPYWDLEDDHLILSIIIGYTFSIFNYPKVVYLIWILWKFIFTFPLHQPLASSDSYLDNKIGLVYSFVIKRSYDIMYS